MLDKLNTAIFDATGATARQQLLTPYYAGQPVYLDELRQPADKLAGVIEYGFAPIYPTLSVPDPAEKREVMAEIAGSLRMVEYCGSKFEIVTVKGRRSAADYMLHISTYSSAASENMGNVSELADQVLHFPDYNHVYVSSFGNGATSPIPKEEGQRDYTQRTGRFTWERNGKTVPLPVITNLYRALSEAGVGVTKIMGTDSAGGSYATALGVAMEPGQLSHAFFSERAGFVNLSALRIIGGIALYEQFVNAYAHRKTSLDPARLTSEMIEEARQYMQQYGDSPERTMVMNNKVGFSEKIGSMWRSMHTLRRGPNGRDNPLLAEANALHQRHEGAHFTYAMATADPLYKSAKVGRQAGRAFLLGLDQSSAYIYVLEVPGTHATNTHWPLFFNDVKKRALSL